jgi:hypothetical protein
VVVGHGTRQDDVDVEAQCGLGQAIDEGVVGVGIWAQQELPLGAAARDHVEAAGDHLAR